MTPERLPSRELVLVGSGHTHLHVVRMWGMHAIADVQLTLIASFSRAAYSGMLPGTLAGLYQPDEMQIDLRRLCDRTGVRLIVAEARGLDPDRREILLADRPPVRFDVASIGIGSVPRQHAVWHEHPQVLSIKPMATFLARFAATLDRGRQATTHPLRLAVVGAGAGGVEITLCLQGWLKARGLSAELALFDSNEQILPGYGPGAVERMRRILNARGVAVHTQTRIEDFNAGALRDTAGRTYPADLVIWAVGAAAPDVLEGFRLPKCERGFLAVRDTLQTTADLPVFAVGDTATLIEHKLPKAGVYAVREGPILWANLRHWFAGQPLEAYRPQGKFLSLLATGDGRAVLDYHGWSAEGEWVWKLKNHIDRKFVRMYQDVPQRMVSPRATMPAPEEAMRCLGCGGKVGATALSEALARLNLPDDPGVRVGLNAPDDATVLDLTRGAADVLSVDFFRAFLDDPYLVGRIAAVNALSDIWAMGATPRGGLAVVTVPVGAPRAQSEMLYQVLAGMVRELSSAGAALWGGHTIEGSELTVGLSVAGDLGGREPCQKGSLKPGDRLILTKPLGTGVLLVGQQHGLARAEWIDAMLTTMLRSNARPAEIALRHGVTAMTDITGFGLAGHLTEMLTASGVSARLELARVPLLDGVRELLAQGLKSTLADANRESTLSLEATSGGSENAALFDPQTSGGLLIGVAP
ncbi:MAG TPA: selenide, water dikinase SelD, partial [Planctomycetaceae bacterium]|nr:selenide, water dikinase SelD [Planctomycetaceae bacterium]